jgi:hypothetical protein
MAIYTVKPEVTTDELLPGAQFGDAYAVSIDHLSVTARQVAECMLMHPPRWIDALMSLRNLIVAPFGLKAAVPSKSDSSGTIWIFPIVSETPDRVVAGFDDKHLDFRVIVDVAPGNRRRRVTATTLVRTHNWLGRAYLIAVMPFHKIIVQSLLRQLSMAF